MNSGDWAILVILQVMFGNSADIYLLVFSSNSGFNFIDINETHLVLSSERLKLIELNTKNSEVIIASALSSDGRWMAYSTSSGVRMFLINLVS